MNAGGCVLKLHITGCMCALFLSVQIQWNAGGPWI